MLLFACCCFCYVRIGCVRVASAYVLLLYMCCFVRIAVCLLLVNVLVCTCCYVCAAVTYVLLCACCVIDVALFVVGVRASVAVCVLLCDRFRTVSYMCCVPRAACRVKVLFYCV